MENIRKYGKEPFGVALIHGGPGAAGELAPVAKELSCSIGVLEPLQTENTIDGQLVELKYILETLAELPITLIGYSWGAWLSYIFASKYPELVKKLILVSSGPFEAKYAKGIMQTRMSRLSDNQRKEAASLFEDLGKQDSDGKSTLFAKIGNLISKADAYDPIESPDDDVICSYEIFLSVWEQAANLRKSGKLLQIAKNIKCPVIAIHGDYDPHPSEGVGQSLSGQIKDFRFILLAHCGHKPWIEKQAREQFYGILTKEI